MNLQTIKSLDGKVEYVLLPVATYNALHHQITEQFKHAKENEDYELFNPADYIDNPVALARIQAGLTQEELAKQMGVTQAYISKIENQEKVTFKMLSKVKQALDNPQEYHTEFSAIGKQYSKRLHLAKKAITKLDQLSVSIKIDEFDKEDLLYIAHSSLWSSLEGYTNFLLKMLGFRNNDCGFYISKDFPINISTESTTNAAIALDSKFNLYYYNRVSRPSLKKITTLSEKQYQQISQLFSFELNEVKNTQQIKKKLSNTDLKKMRSITKLAHKKLERQNEKLACIKEIINSIDEKKLHNNLNRIQPDSDGVEQTPNTFLRDRDELIKCLESVINIISDKTEPQERKIRNNNTHINVTQIETSGKFNTINEAESHANNFYSSDEFQTYYAHGLNTDIIKNTFSVFDNFIKHCTLFFKNHISNYDLFVQFEDSVSIDERLDRMSLHNLLVNTLYDQELLLSSGQTSLIDKQKP